jgi:ribonuclease HI
MGTRKRIGVRIYIDGGARGNPGPAAAGIVIRSADDQTVLHEAGLFLGETTNNVAEYSALLAGLRAARRLGAVEAEVFSDSELLVRQMTGEYRVRNEGLQPLHAEAQGLTRAFERFGIRHVRRDDNKDADRLANLAMNRKANVEDAAE